MVTIRSHADRVGQPGGCAEVHIGHGGELPFRHLARQDIRVDPTYPPCSDEPEPERGGHGRGRVDVIDG